MTREECLEIREALHSKAVETHLVELNFIIAQKVVQQLNEWGIFVDEDPPPRVTRLIMCLGHVIKTEFLH